MIYAIALYIFAAGREYVVRRKTTPIDTRLMDALGALIFPVTYIRDYITAIRNGTW